MRIEKTSQLSTAEKEAVIEIWNNEYPLSLSYTAISGFDHYLDKLEDKTHFLLLDDEENIRGWSVCFNRDGGRWFALIIHHSIQGKGYGALLLDKLKEEEPILNGWVMDSDNEPKQNGEMYRSPLHFYLKNNFILYPEERLKTETMSAVKIQWVKPV